MSLIDLSDKERRLAERVDTAIADGLAFSDRAGGLSFVNTGQVMEFAKMMAVSHIGVRKHLRGNPGACLAVCIQAVEWGMSPFAVANKSYSVNDQIAFESQLIQAVILKRAPIKGRFKVEYRGEGAKRVCRVWAELKDEPGEIVEYESPEFASIQPKNSPLWKTDPDQQQFYYSGRALCRRHFPDVLLGVYAEDEFDARTHFGPDNAKDITPPRTLKERLDMLAKPAADNSTSDLAETDHDPETGEVIPPKDIHADTTGDSTDTQNTAADAPPAAAASAGSAEPGAKGEAAETRPAASSGDTRKAELTAQLELAATHGTRRLTLAFGKLSEAEDRLFSEKERATLHKTAKAAEKAEGG